MTQPCESDLAPLRQKLLEKKLGNLLDWTVPNIQRTIGPFDPEPFIEFESRRLDVVGHCRKRLCTYCSAELATLLGGSGDTADIIIPFWNSFMREMIEKLRKTVPPWYAAGFGHPDHVADFEYWAKMPSFVVTELTCLSIGIEPDRFPIEKFLSLKKVEMDTPWPPLQFLLRRREQLQRRFDPGRRNWTVGPTDFIAWTASVDFDVHPIFLRLLQQYHRPVPIPPQTATKVGAVDKREIDKIATIITVLAIEKLRYDPRAARSEVPKKITAIAALNGIKVSQETVLKYLRRGATFLPKAGQAD